MRTLDAITTLEELGASQWGLITTAQAGAYEISRVALGRLRDAGVIHPLRRGVWALPSADHGPLQELRAAWLATDPKRLAADRRGADVDVAVSHSSAAAVHSLGDLIPSRHEFTVEKRRQTTHDDVFFHRGQLAGDIKIVEGLPVTSIPRTVGDLAAASVDFDHLADIIRDALSSPDVRWRDLVAQLDQVAGRYGYDQGSELVDSSMEQAGLPEVVASLAESSSLFRMLNRQWVTAFNHGVLGSMPQGAQAPAFMADLGREMGRLIAEGAGFRALVPSTDPQTRKLNETGSELGCLSTDTSDGDCRPEDQGSGA